MISSKSIHLMLPVIFILGMLDTSYISGQSTSGRLQKVIFDDRSGIGEDRYKKAFGNAWARVENSSKISTNYLQDLTTAALANFIQNVDILSSRPYRDNKEFYLNDFHRLLSNKTVRYVGPRDIYLTKVTQTIDYDSNEIIVDVEGYFSLQPRSWPKNLPKFTTSINAMDYIENRGTISEPIYEISLGNLLVALFKDKDFKLGLRKALEDYFKGNDKQERLSFMDDNTKKFMKAIIEKPDFEITLFEFSSGSFAIPFFVSNMMRDVVAPKIEELLTPGSSMKILCIGYADIQKISSKIEYRNHGDISMPPQKEAPLISQEMPLLEKKIITNNLQLSIARGYEGIDVLYDMLRERLKSKIQRIKFYYSGEGTANASPILREADRRMVFRVTITKSKSLRKGK